MAQPETTQRIDEIATEALTALGTGRQVTPFSSRYPGFALADAYDVAARIRDLRATRGETAIGRKIGFTNRAVWGGYGISGPIWNFGFDCTVHDLTAVGETFPLTGLAEPRIEPEIILHVASAPRPDMSDDELLSCIDWVAHGFEVVHSIFPNWTFTAADAVAAYGVHGGLLIGDRHPISGHRSRWAKALSNFSVELLQGDGVRARGHARDVLGGPVQALRFLIQELARYPERDPLAPGEIVTTGTLTEAMPAIPGDTWCTVLSGIEIDGLRLRFQ